MKYVLVTGGVVSGLGKGVTASSIGLLLQACDLRVTSIKIGLFLFFSFFCSQLYKFVKKNVIFVKQKFSSFGGNCCVFNLDLGSM